MTTLKKKSQKISRQRHLLPCSFEKHSFRCLVERENAFIFIITLSKMKFTKYYIIPRKNYIAVSTATVFNVR